MDPCGVCTEALGKLATERDAHNADKIEENCARNGQEIIDNR